MTGRRLGPGVQDALRRLAAQECGSTKPAKGDLTETSLHPQPVARRRFIIECDSDEVAEKILGLIGLANGIRVLPGEVEDGAR